MQGLLVFRTQQTQTPETNFASFVALWFGEPRDPSATARASSGCSQAVLAKRGTTYQTDFATFQMLSCIPLGRGFDR